MKLFPDLTASSSGKLLSEYQLPFPAARRFHSILKFKLVLNETALVVYLNDSVTLMTLNDQLAKSTFTEIMSLDPFGYSNIESDLLPTFAVEDRFYSVARGIIRCVDLE